MMHLQKLKAWELAGEGMVKERTGLFTIKISGRSGQFLMFHQRQLHCSVSSSMIRVYRIHYLKKRQEREDS